MIITNGQSMFASTTSAEAGDRNSSDGLKQNRLCHCHSLSFQNKKYLPSYNASMATDSETANIRHSRNVAGHATHPESLSESVPSLPPSVPSVPPGQAAVAAAAVVFGRHHRASCVAAVAAAAVVL